MGGAFLQGSASTRGRPATRLVSPHPPTTHRPPLSHALHTPTSRPSLASPRLPGVYLKDMPLSQLMEAARAAVVGQATSILQDDPAADLPYIVLDLPCSFFALRALRHVLPLGWLRAGWVPA